jgi:hypothetical protein
LLPSSELVVFSLFVSIQKLSFNQQDDQNARGRLLHVYTYPDLIASRFAEGASVGNGKTEV